MPGPKSDKVWSDAIRKAVHEYHEAEGPDGKVKKQRYLNTLAANLVKSAEAGNIEAMKEIGNRLDGKAVQPTDNKHNVAGKVQIELVKAE